MTVRSAAGAVLLMLLAGCSAAPGTTTFLTTTPEPGPVTTTITFHVRNAGPIVQSEPNGGPVDVAAGVSLATVEATWSCGTPSCQLVLAMRDPDGTAVNSTRGVGHAILNVTSPKAGRWNAAVFPDGAATTADGEIIVSAFP